MGEYTEGVGQKGWEHREGAWEGLQLGQGSQADRIARRRAENHTASLPPAGSSLRSIPKMSLSFPLVNFST